MMNTKFWTQLLIFLTALLSILLIRENLTIQLIEAGNKSYQSHTLLDITSNVILIIISIIFIRKNNLSETAGISNFRPEKWYLLIFPFVYLVLLNVLLMDDVNTNKLIPNIFLLLLHTLSIGFAEELSIRGFLQSHFIRQFGNSKKNIILSVFGAAIIFGLLHFIKFDKGIYGELSQFCFATFIGVTFGSILVITKSIYPLIIVHTIIDFAAKLDSTGLSINAGPTEVMSVENAIIISLLTLPCLLYGIFLMKKYPLEENMQYSQV